MVNRMEGRIEKAFEENMQLKRITEYIRRNWQREII